MSKDDAFTPPDELIELTDIVEQGTLPEAADEKSDSAFEQELDALFGESDMDATAASVQDVNPDEELTMPDMSDVDSLLSNVGAGDSDPVADVGADIDLDFAEVESAGEVEGVKELLADLLSSDGPEDSGTTSSGATSASGKDDEQTASGSSGFEMDDSDVDDLDALLAEINSDSEPAGVSAPGAKPAAKVAESIASEVAESVTPQEEQKQASPASPPDDLDALFAELEGSSEAAPALQDSAPAPQASPQASPQAAPQASPQAAPVEPVVEVADIDLDGISSEADDTLSELDALIDDIMSPGDPASTIAASAEATPAEPSVGDVQEATPVSDALETEEEADVAEIVAEVEVDPTKASAPAVEVEADAFASFSDALEENPAQAEGEFAVEAQAMPEEAQATDQVAGSPSAPAEAPLVPGQAPGQAPVQASVQAGTGVIDLDMLAKELASGPLLAAMQAIIAQEVDKQLANQAVVQAPAQAGPDAEELKALVQDLVNKELEAKIAELEANLEEKLNEGMDKATAAAAARIIREEIAALAEAL